MWSATQEIIGKGVRQAMIRYVRVVEKCHTRNDQKYSEVDHDGVGYAS